MYFIKQITHCSILNVRLVGATWNQIIEKLGAFERTQQKSAVICYTIQLLEVESGPEMQRSFDQLVPKEKYPFMATTGVAYGDGWFVNLTVYTTSPKEANSKIALLYVGGITADSTIDSDLYDPSMTYATDKLLLIRNGDNILKWFWEKDKDSGFRRLSEGEFTRHGRELMKSVRQTELPREKIRSVVRPQLDIFYWRPRND